MLFPTEEERQQGRKSVQFNEEVEVKTVERAAAEPVSIDGDKISELLELLNEADPTGDRPDSERLLGLEGTMGGWGNGRTDKAGGHKNGVW